MYCKNCGNELDDNADVCLKCGVLTDKGKISTAQTNTVRPVSNPDDNPSYGLQMIAILFPIVGLIMGLVYFSKGKPRCGRRYLLSGVISFAVVFTLLYMFRNL